MSSECIVIVSPFFSLLTEFSRVNIGHPDVAVNPYGKSPRAVILEPGKRRIVLCLDLFGEQPGVFILSVCVHCASQGNTLPHHAIGSQDRLSSMRNKQLQATVLSVA